MNTQVTRAVGIAITLALTLSGGARAAQSAFSEAQFELERAQKGEAGASERANALFKKLTEIEPENPIYLAYYGSSFTLRGRDARAPWEKMKLTEQGLDLLDKAVAMLTPAHDRKRLDGVPVSLHARLIAASTFLAVPPMFNHREAAKAVLSAALSSPVYESAPPGIRAGIQFQAAVLARKEANIAAEAQALQRVLALNPDASLTQKATLRLKELHP
jgi:tetratricopeptide (TPR) repeat protein